VRCITIPMFFLSFFLPFFLFHVLRRRCTAQLSGVGNAELCWL
jgi:hypothetical protein